jgi:predicted NUDIX family phosphoesterase
VDELVLVVARSSLMGDPGWYGIERGDLERRIGIIEEAAEYLPRGVAERDPSMKQVIPYVVVRDERRILLMQRTRAGGDVRLHDRFTIGVGGHVGPNDGGVAGGLRREWDEELVAGFEPGFRLVGLLNDDTTEVGSVHVGIVFEVESGGRPVAIRETDKLSGSFVTLDEANAVRDRMESWSALVLDDLRDRRPRDDGGGTIRPEP